MSVSRQFEMQFSRQAGRHVHRHTYARAQLPMAQVLEFLESQQAGT